MLKAPFVLSLLFFLKLYFHCLETLSHFDCRGIIRQVQKFLSLCKINHKFWGRIYLRGPWLAFHALIWHCPHDFGTSPPLVKIKKILCHKNNNPIHYNLTSVMNGTFKELKIVCLSIKLYYSYIPWWCVNLNLDYFIVF